MTLDVKVLKRLFYGTVLVLILAVFLWLEGWLSSRNYFILGKWARGVDFVLLVALIASGGVVELARMSRIKDFVPEVKLLIFLVVLIVLEPFWAQKFQGPDVLAATVMGGMIIAALYQGFRLGNDGTIANLSLGSFVIIYLGLGGYFLVRIRFIGLEADTTWGQISHIVMYLACVKSADIGAYFTGRFLGRHKWVPSISKGKTWEGLLGGIVAAVITASLFAAFSGIMYNIRVIIFGVVIAICGQLGDLLESMLKRDAGKKDSTALIPEFGGVLDLVDSPLAAAPVAYFLFQWL